MEKINQKNSISQFTFDVFVVLGIAGLHAQIQSFWLIKVLTTLW